MVSGLVLRAHGNLRLAFRIQRDVDLNRPAADLAVLDVPLLARRRIDEHGDRLPAVRTSDIEGRQHQRTQVDAGLPASHKGDPSRGVTRKYRIEV